MRIIGSVRKNDAVKINSAGIYPKFLKFRFQILSQLIKTRVFFRLLRRRLLNFRSFLLFKTISGLRQNSFFLFGYCRIRRDGNSSSGSGQIIFVNYILYGLVFLRLFSGYFRLLCLFCRSFRLLERRCFFRRLHRGFLSLLRRSGFRSLNGRFFIRGRRVSGAGSFICCLFRCRSLRGRHFGFRRRRLLRGSLFRFHYGGFGLLLLRNCFRSRTFRYGTFSIHGIYLFVGSSFNSRTVRSLGILRSFLNSGGIAFLRICNVRGRPHNDNRRRSGYCGLGGDFKSS